MVSQGAEAAVNGPESSLARMLRVLDLVEESPAGLGFEELLSRLGFTRSTLYRYLKTLGDSGLLTSIPSAGYVLGPRVAELDFAMRGHDPLILAARDLMGDLARSTPGIALLCRRYRERVLCVHQERAEATFESTYERGKPRPLLKGAASVVILASMSAGAVARLYAREPESFAEARLGTSLEAVRASLRRIRRRGWEASEGRLTPDVTGIAAPVFDRSGVLGSLSVTLGRTGLLEPELRRIATAVVAAAQKVTEACAGEIPNSGT